MRRDSAGWKSRTVIGLLYGRSLQGTVALPQLSALVGGKEDERAMEPSEEWNIQCGVGHDTKRWHRRRYTHNKALYRSLQGTVVRTPNT
jgi:hypothetical protein